ncbi:methionine ABC transporter ATP-binding protein [Arthrobacter psychrolactophilus]|uniref:Methionine ABC transporter ATP-binding protein n=1 Tax=Arthrobacter psychrolactophilus TaxID=92442 RepID=A0A2V5ILP8_9MICC|nr:ABC transporter ATP-binding protein [Arthrobacter psychrolactophilus]PYI37051.1 methionine ABC transporter ATP-binding protein [Arthrobacter psychrolactophilus]
MTEQLVADSRRAQSPLLSVRDLQVEFTTSAGIARALDGVSFDVQAGETLAILGESGSGKSVTSQAIMALLPKPAGSIVGGSILYDGIDLAKEPVSRVRDLCATDIAMIFQDPLSSLNPVFRIGDQVAEPFRRRLGMGKKEALARALELLKRVGIADAERRISNYPHQFSGGQRQRIMIAMAIALKPRILIADEPTTALDVTVQAQIMRLLAELQAETGMAMILISHDLGVVADSASRVAIMYAGRIIETGGIREVYDHPQHPYTKGLLDSIPGAHAMGEPLRPIVGSPPNLLDLPAGCAFHPRCPIAVPECRAAVPSLREPEGAALGHHVACIRAEEVRSHD